MLGTLDFAARVAIAAALLLACLWLSVQALELYLLRRGPVWQVPHAGRRRRILESRIAALLLAVVLGLGFGLLARCLIRVPLWAGWPVAALVAGIAAWRAGSALKRIVEMGEALLGGPDAPVEAVPPPLDPTPPGKVGRRIVILCDGTGNRPPDADDPFATNIWKIGQALGQSEAQTVWYTPGVATGNSRTAKRAAALGQWAGRLWLAPLATALGWYARLRITWEGMTGTGLSEVVLDAYSEVVRQYRPGDRIYIFGFSRGAYAARATAGVICHGGLLRPSNLNYAPALISLYRARRSRGRTIVPVRNEFLWPGPVPIEMLGVFDTVASLGAPLWGWWFNPRGMSNRALNTSPVPNCRHVYHALSMDERRATFFPTLFWAPEGRASWPETLEQVWFRGVHSDIGGGYPETGLSDITLGWMLERAARHGLELRPDALAGLRPDVLARPHDETARNSFWNWVGTWPRWARVDPAPASTGAGISVHPSVFERAARVLAETGRHDLHDLSPGQTVGFRAEAQRQWDRTGLVLQGGEGGGPYYRLRWKGGVWRDALCPPCGPAGHRDGERPGDPRWRARWRRRLRDAPWMTLCATLAGPRRWPLRELPLSLAFAYLFQRDPRMLLNQIAPLGLSLEAEGSSVLIRSERPPSLLYLFANDLWQTYPNNSGELELELTRLPEGPEGGDISVWLLPATGPWRFLRRGAGGGWAPAGPVPPRQRWAGSICAPRQALRRWRRRGS